jgi:hypothetical protein
MMLTILGGFIFLLGSLVVVGGLLLYLSQDLDKGSQ